MKFVVYQVLTRLWRNGRFSDFDEESLRTLKEMGVDIVWYTGIPRHATGKDFVKGDPGSPYAVCDWRDVNPYLADNPDGRLDEFKELVARTHGAGLKVCMDFIPNHVSRDYSGPLPHHDWCDWDWTDTFKLDWGDPGTVDEFVSVLSFWLSLGVDAFRCDMVELVPSDRLALVLESVRMSFPETMFIAEVYSKDNYRKYLSAGFDLLYDKSGAYDILRGIRCNGWSAEALTWNWQWLSDIQDRMLNFLENHDEQRVTRWAGDPYWPGLAFSLLFNRASFMLYFGEESGESADEAADGRTSIFNWTRPVTSACRPGAGSDIFERFRHLLSLAHEPAFASGGVWDLCYLQNIGDGFDRSRHFAFLRYDDKTAYVVFCNFSSVAASVRLLMPPELDHPAMGDSVRLEVGEWDFVCQKLSPTENSMA